MRRKFLRIFLEKLPVFQAFYRAVEAEAVAKFKLREPILDLGCGDGIFGKAVFKKEKKIIGLDLDKKALSQARRKKIYQNLVAADARSLPFKSGQFNSVLANSSLEHINNLKPVLKEVYRVLDKDGVFVLTAPSEKRTQLYPAHQILSWLGLKNLARRASRKEDQIFRHFNCWSGKKWQQELKKVGFKQIKYEYRGGSATNWWSDIFLLLAPIAFLERKLFGRYLGWRQWTAPLVFNLLKGVEDKIENENGSVIIVQAKR